DVEN
ncbi:hypothetical protein BVRB_040290, partial [Beta vulgaris subsp. vulgaris]